MRRPMTLPMTTTKGTLTPVDDNLIVKPIGKGQVDPRRNSRVNSGTVVAAGPGTVLNGVRIPMQIPFGALVHYGYPEAEVTIEKVKYHVVREGAVYFYTVHA